MTQMQQLKYESCSRLNTFSLFLSQYLYKIVYIIFTSSTVKLWCKRKTIPLLVYVSPTLIFPIRINFWKLEIKLCYFLSAEFLILYFPNLFLFFQQFCAHLPLKYLPSFARSPHRPVLSKKEWRVKTQRTNHKDLHSQTLAYIVLEFRNSSRKTK